MSARRLAVLALLAVAGYVAVGYAALTLSRALPDVLYLLVAVGGIMGAAIAAGRYRARGRHRQQHGHR